MYYVPMTLKNRTVPYLVARSGRVFLRALCMLIALSLFNAAQSNPEYFNDVDFTKLQNELGTALPDGSGVKVDLVESAFQVQGQDVWMPNPGSIEFVGKTLNNISGNPAGIYSAHAMSVALNFFGLSTSTAPGVTIIDTYSATGYVLGDFLRTQVGGFPIYQPAITSSRVVNHSWIGSIDPAWDEDVLARVDWVVETDELIQVAGFTGSVTYKLMANGFNSIAVDRTSNPTNGGSQNIGGIYTAGRTKPDIVAPDTSASNSTPRVSSAVALLVQAGHDNPSWSTDPDETSTTNRSGNTIYNAERSEVIKAALMAGADRRTDNVWPGNIGYALGNVDDYRLLGANQTANGLDRRYGAGQLNVYNSYHILAGTEQNSDEDQPSGGGSVTLRGFDYDPEFGGSAGSNSTATYYLPQSADPIRLIASLVWNLDIDGGRSNNFDRTGTLYNLDLFVYDVSDPQNWILVHSSTSTIDNTENAWLLLDGGKDYALQVTPGSGQSAFNWDYAVAWQALPVPPLNLSLSWLPPEGSTNQSYYYDGIRASGGEPPYSYSVSAGGPLTWDLTIQDAPWDNSIGTIWGTPYDPTAGTQSLTLQVTDANSDTATVQTQMKIHYVEDNGGCGTCHTAGQF